MIGKLTSFTARPSSPLIMEYKLVNVRRFGLQDPVAQLSGRVPAERDMSVPLTGATSAAGQACHDSCPTNQQPQDTHQGPDSEV